MIHTKWFIDVNDLLDKSKECFHLDWGTTSPKRLISSGFEFPTLQRATRIKQGELLPFSTEAEGLLRIFRGWLDIFPVG